MAAVLAVGAAARLVADWGREKDVNGIRLEKSHLTIDGKFVAEVEDAFSLIEPLWGRVDIYGSPEDYERTAGIFSCAQRHLFAVDWYRKEVNNGGHHQFFFNPTGIVWRDALAGLQAAGATEHAAILKAAADRAGKPSLDRAQRVEQLGEELDFEDLDDRFYNATEDLEARLLSYARNEEESFFFSGDVERPVFPVRN